MGALLSLAIAEKRPEKVAGVCALSTTFRYDGWSIPSYTKLAFLLPLFRSLGIGRKSVFMEAPPYGIKDEALRKRIVEAMHSGDSAAAGLPGNPWWSIIELRALSAHVLLLSKSRSKDWEGWKKQVNAPALRPASCLQFDHLHFVLQAALDGLGFAVAPVSLITHDLASGRLVSPLPSLRLPLTRHYLGMAPDPSPETLRFVQWLQDEISA